MQRRDAAKISREELQISWSSQGLSPSSNYSSDSISHLSPSIPSLVNKTGALVYISTCCQQSPKRTVFLQTESTNQILSTEDIDHMQEGPSEVAR